MTPSLETTAKRISSLSASWKQRLDYTDGLAGTGFHNTWRAIRFTKKGKLAGCEKRWELFRNFRDDMLSSYKRGLRIYRVDKNKPFSKDNCIWVNKEELHSKRLVMLKYLGQEKSLKEWCVEYELNHNGVKSRYYRGKNYTPEEILFGKKRKSRREMLDKDKLTAAELRAKASKMISAYRVKDLRRGLSTDITIDWMVERIINGRCSYCDTDKNVGCDRIDNSIGHTMSNCVPACYRCNTMKNTFFNFDQMRKIGQFVKVNIDQRQ